VLFSIKKTLRGGGTIGEYYRKVVDTSGVNIGVERLPSNTGGYFSARDNTLKVNSQALNEDNKTVAAILAHEFTHVAQSVSRDGAGLGCVEREVDAFRDQIVIWVILWDPLAPGRTQRERFMNAMAEKFATEGDPWLYKYVVDSDGYQDQCRLWVP
jgi:hypothetical protein